MRATLLVLCALTVLRAGPIAAAQEPSAPQAVSQQQLDQAIGKLGDLDYATRASAARTVRRVPSTQAVPALLTAVAEHVDGYVRYRSLVLLTGFNDPRTRDAMREALASPNDRLRAVACSFFEHNPDPAMTPVLLAALGTEQGEFVRPALVRALAALRGDRRIQAALIREAGRGEDFFRSAVIEALGDYQAAYAFDAVAAIAQQDGPLLDDAALALGKMGDHRALPILGALQHRAPRATQPFLGAAVCLLGLDCDKQEAFLVETLAFSDENAGYQELLRGSASGLAALAVVGRQLAAESLVRVGTGSQESTRAPVAIAVATVALRNTPLMFTLLQNSPSRAEAIALIADGFDMLEEDLDKERFFALARKTYWSAPENSPTRELMQTLIGKLDF